MHVGTDARTTVRRRSVAPVVVPIVLIFVVCFGAVAMHVDRYRHLGPVDEAAHLDYVNRLLDGQIPRYGDKLNETTRHEVACRGIEAALEYKDTVNCGGTRTDRQLPEIGDSYEAGQPPIYYVVTATLKSAMPERNEVDAIKLVGGLWLAGGAIAFFLTLRKLSVPLPYATVTAVVLSLSPPLLYAASSVSNDIAVFTFGAFGLWAVVALMSNEKFRYEHVVAAALVGILGGLIKPTALLVVIALALAIGLQQWWMDRRKPGLLLAGALLAGVLFSTGVWGLVVHGVQHISVREVQPFLRLQVPFPDPSALFQQPSLFAMSNSIRAFIPSPWRTDWRLGSLTELAMYVQIGILILPVFVKWPTGRTRSVGVAFFLAVAVSGPYYIVLFYISTRSHGGGTGGSRSASSHSWAWSSRRGCRTRGSAGL